MQQPGERHFGKRLTTFGGNVVQVADLLQAFRCQRAFLEEAAVMCDAAVCGHAVEIAVREQALLERRECDEAFAELFCGFLQAVAFHSAVENVVAVLVDDERHVQLIEDCGGLFERRAVVVAQAHVQRFAALHGGCQRAHGFFERRGGIHVVMVENVDVVKAETFEALIEGGEQIFAAAEIAVGAEPHFVAGFGADDQFVTMMMEIFVQETAAVLFRAARFGAVIVGEVEMRDAVVECGEHDVAHGGVWRNIAEIMPKTERNRWKFQTARTHMVVGHGVVSGG